MAKLMATRKKICGHSHTQGSTHLQEREEGGGAEIKGRGLRAISHHCNKE